MIEISNSEESFFIENDRLKKYKKYSKYINKNKHISVELVFFYDKTFRKNKIISIQKRLRSTGEPVGDLIKDFKILECNSNKIILSGNDYKELKKLVENLILEENLNEEETRKFIENSFRDGQVKTTGTDIEKILPPMRRFGGSNRNERKQTIIERIMKFFEKYFGIV